MTRIPTHRTPDLRRTQVADSGFLDLETSTAIPVGDMSEVFDDLLSSVSLSMFRSQKTADMG